MTAKQPISCSLIYSFLYSLITLLSLGCTGKSDLPAIGKHVSSPMDIATAQNPENGENFFFALNANLNHSYQTGSLLIMDVEAEKLQAVAIPRLGRSLKIAGDRLLVTYDENKGARQESRVELYQILFGSQGELPRLELRQNWETADCRGVNTSLRPDYPYFAVACESGKLFVGTFHASDLSQSTLQPVRHYPNFVRRAMHIDTKRHLLFAFVSGRSVDSSAPLYDKYMKDSQSWDFEAGVVVPVANDVPDELQLVYEKGGELNEARSRKARLRLSEEGSSYQYVIYAFEDPANSDQGQFKFREFKDVQAELHWLYFTAEDQEGKAERPVLDEKEKPEDYKYYRANFWEALADPDLSKNADDRRFYLAHRGQGTATASPHSNDLLLFTLRDEIQSYSDLATKKFTHEIFTIKRVFGFDASEASKRQKTAGEDYLGAFAFTQLGDEHLLLTNHFRTRRDFDKEYFALKAFKGEAAGGEVLYQQPAYTPSSEASLEKGYYYQFALSSPLGEPDAPYVHVLASSFYDDSLRLLRLDPQGLSSLDVLR